MTEIARSTPQETSSSLNSLQRWAKTLQWWPSLAGAVAAGVFAFDLAQGRDLAPVVTASALIYLGAAALQKKSSAWPLFFTSLLLGGLGSFLFDLNAAWVLIILGGPLLAYGVVKGGVIRPMSGLPLQTIGMLTFSAAALVALAVEPKMGALLVAVALFAHAAWDVYHHWVDRVVSRSLSEFCFVLDTALGIIILVTIA